MENVEYTQLSNEHMEAISSSDTVSLLSLALINTKDRSSQEFDIDPTPRPLCIVKRRSVRTPHALRSSKPPSSPATGDSLPGRSSISTPIPIPRRRSSTAFPRARIFPKEVAVSDSLGSETQSRMSSSSFSTAPSGGCSKGLEDLKVRKQRRKSKSCTTAELVRDINDFYPPPFLLSSSDSEGLSSYSSNHKASSRYTTPPSRIVSVSEDTPKAIPALNRDISVGAFLKAELLNPPIAIDPPKELADQGAFSSNEFADRTAEPDPGRFNVLPRIIGGYDIINDNITQTPRLNRTLNVGPELPPKKKIFSRVLSGFNLLGRSNSIIGIRSGNIQTNRALSVSLRQKGDEAIRSSSETKPPSLKSVSTLVSRPQSTHSVLGGTNATSPRPPESEFTPQTSIDSLATSTTEYTKLRALARPQIAPLFQARLVVTPELESVDTDYSQSFWVAIEVTGDVAIPSLGCSVPVPREIGLDIILLMDLSVSTSPATYMSSRGVCSSVASLLDPRADRLAILTSYANSSCPHKIYRTHVLFPLQPPDLGKVLEALDAMTIIRPNNRAAPSDDGLNHAIEAAFNIFLSPEPPDRGSIDGNLAAEIYGHLFLISEKPPKNIDLPERCETVQIHFVNPSVVPWTGSREGNNGWQLDSNFSCSSSTNSALRGDSWSSLKAIIEHARLGNSLGQLRDLSIGMKPMSNCEVEAIMGETKHQRLSPGQRVLVFAKLRVGPHSLLQHPATVPRPQDQGAQTSTHLLEQLDAILGQAKTEILKVEVKYKHSLFSADTIISTTSTARLRRHTQQSSWNSRPNGKLSSSSDNHQSCVQRHLGHFIASNHSPIRALSALEDMFGETTAPPACPAHFEQLRGELRHQAWISDRLDALQNEVLYGHSGSMPLLDHPKNNKNQASTTTRTQKTGSVIVNKRLVRIPSKESVDEARRIWVEMRKKARGRESIRELSDYMPVSDENLMKIAEKALSNKRSLGADTLKSIATGRRKSGLFAPWL